MRPWSFANQPRSRCRSWTTTAEEGVEGEKADSYFQPAEGKRRAWLDHRRSTTTRWR